MRVLSFKQLTEKEVAEVHEWLRHNNVDLPPTLRLGKLLKPNYPQAVRKHCYSKVEKLAMKIASWESFNFLLQKHYNMSLERSFLELLAMGIAGATEILFHEFILLQKRQRLLMDPKASEAFDKSQSMVISEISGGSEEDQTNVKTSKGLIPYSEFEKLRQESHEKDARIAEYEERIAQLRAMDDELNKSLKTLKSMGYTMFDHLMESPITE